MPGPGRPNVPASQALGSTSSGLGCPHQGAVEPPRSTLRSTGTSGINRRRRYESLALGEAC